MRKPATMATASNGLATLKTALGKELRMATRVVATIVPPDWVC